jgi:uncharacterized protein YhbP (UPF0306 family)
MDLKMFIQDYLNKAQIMQIATVHDHQPWVATVYFATDVDMNLYWMSRKDRRHSKEIGDNPKVAGTIVLPHNYGDKVRGLQFEGTALELSDGDAQAGINIYSSRYWVVEDRVSPIQGGDGHPCFQIRPSLFVLYDEVNFPENPRQELKM